MQGAAQALRACMNALKTAATPVPDDFPKGQWTSLFNGKDLTGWTPKLKGYDAGRQCTGTRSGWKTA